MNFAFDQADQSNRLEQKNNKFNIALIIIQWMCLFVCLFVLRLNVPVNNFSVMSGRSHRFLGK